MADDSGVWQSRRRSTAARHLMVEIRKSTVMPDDEGVVVIVSVDSALTSTLMQVKIGVTDSQWHRVVDVDVLQRVMYAINWCRATKPLVPLAVDKSYVLPRDSLLASVAQAVWGFTDVEVISYIRRLVFVAMTQPETVSAARYGDRSADNSAGMECVMKSSLVGEEDTFTDIELLSRTFDEESNGDIMSSSPWTDIHPIHIFVLSNVLRRPIIVTHECTASGTSSPTSSLTTDGGSSVVGVYLPVLHQPDACCKSPVCVLRVGSQFAPLVPRVSDRAGDGLEAVTVYAVPLWRRDVDEPLSVRCLLPGGELPEQALDVYLRLTDLPYTSATSTNVYPGAKYDVIPPDVNLIDDSVTPTAKTTYSRYQTPLEKMRQEHMNEMTSVPVVKLASTTTNTTDDEPRRCVTRGCQFYGRREHGWKCSKCFSDQNLTGGSQTATSSTTHASSLQPKTIFQASTVGVSESGILDLESVFPTSVERSSRVGHVTATTNQQTQSGGTCVNPACHRAQNIRGYCYDCYINAGNDVITAINSAAVTCIMDFCSNPGSRDSKGLCNECFRILCQARLGDSASAAQLLDRTSGPADDRVKCMMDGCRSMVERGQDVCRVCRQKQQLAYDGLVGTHR